MFIVPPHSEDRFRYESNSSITDHLANVSSHTEFLTHNVPSNVTDTPVKRPIRPCLLDLVLHRDEIKRKRPNRRN